MRLSDRDIHAYLQDGSLIVVAPRDEYPFDPYTQVQPCSIDLRLDNRFIKFKNNVDRMDVKDLERVWGFLEVFHVSDKEPLTIQPHGILFGQIYEQLRIPPDVSGKIVGRSRIARLGLAIHATGDFINPEFEGSMPLQIINNNNIPITIYPYMTICQLLLVKLSSPPIVPYPLRSDSPYNRERDAGTSVLHTDPAISQAKREKSVHTEIEKRLVDNYLKEREKDKAMQKSVRYNYNIGEWTMGDKVEIKNTGTISSTSGQLFLGKFDNVYATLNTTEHSELADALKTLKEAIMASSQVPEEKKQEHIEVINQIGEEAAKEKPNKTLLKIMGDGLMTVLKAIPDIAKVVADVAPLIAMLIK